MVSRTYTNGNRILRKNKMMRDAAMINNIHGNPNLNMAKIKEVNTNAEPVSFSNKINAIGSTTQKSANSASLVVLIIGIPRNESTGRLLLLGLKLKLGILMILPSASAVANLANSEG